MAIVLAALSFSQAWANGEVATLERQVDGFIFSMVIAVHGSNLMVGIGCVHRKAPQCYLFQYLRWGLPMGHG